MDLKEVVFANVGGLKTACITRQELVQLMAQRVSDYHDEESEYYQRSMTVFDTNGHAISLANRSKTFKSFLDSADIVHADGQSVVAFSKFCGSDQIPERSATTDAIHDFPNFVKEETRHYLLGGANGVSQRCADILRQQYENLVICGVSDGYFAQQDIQDLISSINAAKPDILWVGLGKPKEQEFVHTHLSSLDVPVIVTCGGCFNYITGDYSRAPQWMQNCGLEWLHRAASQPKNLLWRYLTTNPHAIYCVFKHKFFAKST